MNVKGIKGKKNVSKSLALNHKNYITTSLNQQDSCLLRILRLTSCDLSRS